MTKHPLSIIEQTPPGGAVGYVKRTVNGIVDDEVDFAYLASERWRVRHLSERELIVDGSRFWRRAGSSSGWIFERVEHGSGVHHTGYLKGMIFPQLLPPIAHEASRVTKEENLGENSRRLWVSFEAPVPGSLVVDVSAERRLSRIVGNEKGSVVEIEIVADYSARPALMLFLPTTAWNYPRQS